MIPILYDVNETEFSNMGFGQLSDTTSCVVTEERNGTYELVLKYPKDGIHYSDIEINRIIMAIPSPYRDAQPFRIYKVSKPMRGVITVNAQHISYDLSGITVRPFSGNSVADVLSNIVPNSVNENKFKFSGNSTATHTCNYSRPNSARQILGGMEGSIIDSFGGEYEFDRFNVRWSLNRGTDSGVTIRYGKNLLSLSQDVDASGIVTGVVPYWSDVDGLNVVYGSRVDLESNTDISKVVPLDLSSDFEEQPTIEQLEARAKTFIKNNYTVEPSISCEVSFAIIEQSEEYKEFKLLEKCDLCDTLTVNYPEMGIDSTAKIVKIETDVLKEKYNKVTIGSLRANLAQTIVSQQKSVENVPTRVGVSQMVHDSLGKIMGAQGGSVRLLDTNDDGSPDTLYIADDPDPEKATKVWRFNYLGWAASSNGYNGPFTLGATLEDGLLADFVTAANLTAGTIKSADNGETFFLDLLNGVLRMKASSFSIEGKSVDDIAGSAANSALSDAKKYTDTEIEATNKEIELRATKKELDALGNRVTTAESTITTQAGQIALKVTEDDVSSLIDQKADSIRLKADKISWESTYSSMSEDGKLTCTGAEINGELESKTGIIPGYAEARSEVSFGKYKNGAVFCLFSDSAVNWTIVNSNGIYNGSYYGKLDDFYNALNTGNIDNISDKMNPIREIEWYATNDLIIQCSEGISLSTKSLRIIIDDTTYGDGYTGNVTIGGRTLRFMNGICIGV